MKKYFLSVICLVFVFTSCSNDDDGVSAGADQSHLPLAEGNYWTYEVKGADYLQRDSLYVSNDTVISGNTYYKMRARGLAAGMYAGTLENNGIRKQNGALLLTGNAGLDFGPLQIPLPVADFVIFDAHANDNAQLGNFSGTTVQMVDQLPLNISYTLSSTAGATLPTFAAQNGTTYANVKAVKVTLNLTITASFNLGGVILPVTVLMPQNVVISTRYYAEDIGMVYSSTQINYTLEDFSDFDVTLPIPLTVNEIQTESLLTYSVDL